MSLGNKENAEFLYQLANNEELIEIARQKIEEVLIEWRDSRISQPLRGNGLVVREYDGQDSSIIRFGPETAMTLGLKAIADHLAVKVDQ